MSETTTYTVDEARAMPDGPHRVEWTIGPGWTRGSAICDATGPARCWMVCAEDCGAESWPCNGDDDHHRMRDGGECNVVLFLEESGSLEESYDGPAEPLHTGLIDTEWDQDHYTWCYSAPAWLTWTPPEGHPLSYSDLDVDAAGVVWTYPLGAALPVRCDQASNPTGCPLPPAWPLTPLIRAGRHVDPRGGYPDQPVYDWSEFTDPVDALYDEPHVDPRGEALEAVAAAARVLAESTGSTCDRQYVDQAVVLRVLTALAALDAQQ